MDNTTQTTIPKNFISFAQLPHEIIDKIGYYLPKSTLKALMLTCCAVRNAINEGYLSWKSLILQDYGKDAFATCMHPLNLYKYLNANKRTALEMGIVHMAENGFYWTAQSSAESQFGKVAFCKNVCWLEFSIDFKNVPTGYYNISMRMRLHKDSSADFQAVWTLTPTKYADDSKQVSAGKAARYQHENNYSVWTECVGQGWVRFTFGTCHVTEDCATVRFHCIGGNPFWLSALELDWIVLMPADKPANEDDVIFRCTLEKDFCETPSLPSGRKGIESV